MSSFKSLLSITITMAAVPFAALSKTSPSLPIYQTPGFALSIPCKVAGAVGQCVLDTGAQVSILPLKIDARRFPEVDSVTITSSNGSSVKAPVLQIPSIEIPGLVQRTDTRMLWSDAYRSLKENPYIAMLGGPFFSKGAWTFDIPQEDKAVMGSLKAVAQLSTNRGRLYPPHVKKSLLEVDVMIGKEIVHAFWDCHAQTKFSESFLASHPQMFAPGPGRKGRDALGQERVIPTYFFKDKLCVGRACRQPKTEVDNFAGYEDNGNGRIELLIGMEFIREARWSFDYEKMLFSADFYPQK